VNRVRRLLGTLAIAVGTSLLAIAAQGGGASQSPRAGSAATFDVDAVGPKVGEQIPAFTLTDQAGKQWTRESIMGPKGALLVFFRSADW
jgi:cytochrome oxidase Cu insertion factor (SCO1/SenC/PrrC family)